MTNFELPVQMLSLLLKNQFNSGINPNELFEKLITKLKDYDKIKSENELLKQKFIQLNSEIYSLSLKVEEMQQLKKKRKVYIDNEE
jgi:hypothetical protein